MEQKRLIMLAVLSVLLLSTIPVMAVTGGNVTALQGKYLTAKTDYTLAKQNYLDAKTNFLAYRLQFAERDRTAFLKGQTFMVAGVDQLLKYIDALSSKVQETTAFTDSKKTALTTELAGYSSTLNVDKSALQNTSTIDELRIATNKTRDDWNVIKPQLKRIAGEVILAKADVAVDKAEAADIKLDAKIAELKATGNDTAKLESISAQVKIKIANAREKIALAKDRLAGVKSSGNAQGLLTAADQYVKQANRLMLEIQYLLGQAVREVKHVETGNEGPGIKNATIPVDTPLSPDAGVVG